MLKAGVRPNVRVSRHRARVAPNEYSEAVEKWAREHGGNAKLKWLDDPMNCWAVILTYRQGDPRQMIGEGPQADGEPVLLHEWWTADQWAKRKPRLARRDNLNNIRPGNYAYDLDELGVEGLVQWLDKGNILSGRGEFRSTAHAADVARDNHKRHLERTRASKRDTASHLASDVRRQVYKIPFLPVGISFGKEQK